MYYLVYFVYKHSVVQLQVLNRIQFTLLNTQSISLLFYVIIIWYQSVKQRHTP
jgi:hypothetical protein